MEPQAPLLGVSSLKEDFVETLEYFAVGGFLDYAYSIPSHMFVSVDESLERLLGSLSLF